MIRSILSVVVGYLTMFVAVSTFFAIIVFATMGALPKDPGAFEPPAWMLAAELVWSPIAAFAGGYVCAWIARRNALKHAGVLAGIMFVLGIVSAVGESGMKPAWSSVLVVLLGLIGVMLGARVRLAVAS